MGKRDEIVTAARSYLGVPFRHQGRSRNGIDCLGLVLVVYNQVFGTSHEILGYPRRPDAAEMRRQLREKLSAITPEQARAGDLAHLAYNGEATHLALLTTPEQIIHVLLTPPRRVVEQRLSPELRDRVAGWYRLPGVED
jgi:cell wall-associated NlpC family hydrolase